MSDPIAVRFRLQRGPATVLARLAQKPGWLVRHGDLQEALEAETGNRATMTGVASHIVRARRGIKGHGTITTHYGLGYRLDWTIPPP
jgi:DNA-binding response OmpR family regulator